jgi:hypothetical protein
LKTRLFPRRVGRLSVFATGMMAEGMDLMSNHLYPLSHCFNLFWALPPSQWKSARTTNAIKRLHEEFRRRIEFRSRVKT